MIGGVDVAPELFERLSRGDPEAFREVYARYGARVAAIARHRIGRRLRARLETVDLTQEAWAAVACEAPNVAFANERQFLGWIEGIVERRALREARRWSAQRRRFEREVAGTDAASCPDARAERPSQVLLVKEATARVSVALARLESDDRRVVVLRLLLDLPWREVAAALGVAEECAQMRFTRARRRLAELAG